MRSYRYQKLLEITKNLIKILGRSLIKVFVYYEVAGFQASILLKMNFSTFTFQDFVNCSTDFNNYFKERILMASSIIHFFNLFHLSFKRVSKTVGLLRKFPNLLPKTSKLFVRPQFDHCVIIHDQIYNFRHLGSCFQ